MIAVCDNLSHAVTLAELLSGKDIFFMLIETLDFDDTLFDFGLTEP